MTNPFPAGRVRSEQALVLADRAAAGRIGCRRGRKALDMIASDKRLAMAGRTFPLGATRGSRRR